MVPIAITVNGKVRKAHVEPRTAPRAFPARASQSHRHARRLRHQPVRRVHRAHRRPQRQVVHGLRGAGRRLAGHDDRRPRARRRAAPAAEGLLGGARPAVRLLHARHDHVGGQPARRTTRRRAKQQIREGISGNFCRCTGYQHIVNAIQHAAKREVSHGRSRHPFCRSWSASASSAAKIRG